MNQLFCGFFEALANGSRNAMLAELHRGEVIGACFGVAATFVLWGIVDLVRRQRASSRKG